MKDADTRRLLSGAIHLFLTTSIKGEQVPGRTAPDHLGFDLKPGYLHPDSEAVDYKHTLKVLAYDATTGKPLWEQTAYDGLMYDNRHKSNTYASPTIVTDGKLALRVLRGSGRLRVRLQRQAGLEGIASATSPRRASGPARRRSSGRTCSSCSAIRRWVPDSAIVALDRVHG